MTAFLPALAWNPFISRHGQTTYDYETPTTLNLPISPRSGNSWIKLRTHRHLHPRFREPVTPSKTSQPHENNPSTCTPSNSKQNSLSPPDLVKSDGRPAKGCYEQSQLVTLSVATNKLSKTAKSSRSGCIRKKSLIQRHHTSKHYFQNDTPTRAKQKGLQRPSREEQVNVTASNLATKEDSPFPEPFPTLTGNSEISPLQVARTTSRCCHGLDLGRSVEDNLTAVLNHGEHRQRSSNASSGFVHTMKTASISNTSLSIIPRSSRIGRSSDSYGRMTGCSRHSLDSVQPAIGVGLDEASFQRGLRRKQIINELLMTEESYVADLKALVYLYSTLMISSTTISTHLRLSVQRNVMDVLHIHERLLQKLHQAALRAAARKWADTTVPRRLGLTHSTCGKYVAVSRGQHNHRVRTSIDSADVAKAHLTAGVAEPADILDIAEILEEAMAQLFAYEEYCANHQTIAHELQKHLPSLWSTYESGVESLNKSLVALNRRKSQDRKGLTVGDLLIKPVQRLCKYPLLLQDLLDNTYVADSPTAHKALEGVLSQLCVIVRTVNMATDNHITRAQIQRKWSLLDRLSLEHSNLSRDWFRALGAIHLCGVLFLTYETGVACIEGQYAVMVLFDNHFMIALPTPNHLKLEPLAVISLPDLKIESAVNGNGLQSPSSLHTFKIAFTADGKPHELLLSACSTEEEDQWIRGLRAFFRPPHFLHISTLFDQSKMFGNLRALGRTQHPFATSRNSSPVKHDASSAQASVIREVVIRNTHNPEDLQEFRNAVSQLRITGLSVKVLMPKRAERRRLEVNITDIYTKDKLPFPGMIGSKGSRIIRASAGSLARKLSFASMQASLSRRSASLSSKRSYHTIHAMPREVPTFSIRKHSMDGHTPSRHSRPKELPELDTMSSVIERMIGGGSTARKRLSFSSGEKLMHKTSKSSQTTMCNMGPDDPAKLFYEDDSKMEEIEREMRAVETSGDEGAVESRLVGLKRKRWSNPIAKLKGLGSDGIKNMLYSSN